MTHLEKLIHASVETATLTTLSRTTEQIAEEMAREILREPAFRAEMQALIRRSFTQTVTTLTAPRNGRRPRRAAGPRKRR